MIKTSDDIIWFGKYRGSLFTSIVTIDPQYFIWAYEHIEMLRKHINKYYPELIREAISNDNVMANRDTHEDYDMLENYDEEFFCYKD